MGNVKYTATSPFLKENKQFQSFESKNNTNGFSSEQETDSLMGYEVDDVRIKGDSQATLENSVPEEIIPPQTTLPQINVTQTIPSQTIPPQTNVTQTIPSQPISPPPSSSNTTKTTPPSSSSNTTKTTPSPLKYSMPLLFHFNSL